METRQITVDEPDWDNDQWNEQFLQDRKEEGWEMIKVALVPNKPQVIVTFQKVPSPKT